ncbi:MULTISPECIES: YchJ family protein [Idiomarina]|nr:MULTISPECIES: YchJ family metal-binding protein [Idiomarina]RXS41937.1 Zn-binding protein [Idiomarina sp. 29L]
MSSELCPCGSGDEYSGCCEPLHIETMRADTPEQLMRSRYSAFVKQLTNYLLKTWHPSTCPMSLDLSDSPDWLKLQVMSSEQTGDKGKVHFRAFYKEGADVGFMEEHSDFVREQGRWFYLSGKVK